MNRETRPCKIMITGLPACGKSVLIKLLDGHPNVYATHTHDKILFGLYGFDEKQIQEHSNKVFGDSGAYAENAIDFPIMHYRSKEIRLKLSPFFVRHMLSEYTGYYIAEQWSRLGILPDESTSTGYKKEKFNLNFFDYEKEWNRNLSALNGQISPEDFHDCFYDAYFKAWPDYPRSKSGNVNYAFIGPNDPVSASRFLLEEEFHTKIIFVTRSLEGQIVTRALRLFRRNKKNCKDVKYENYIINCLSGDIIDHYTNTIQMMTKLKKEYPEKIYFLDLDELMNEHRQGMNKLIDFLDLPRDEIIYRPTNAGTRVSDEYIKQMNDDIVKIDESVKQLLQLEVNGLRGYKKNNQEKIDWRIIFPYFKLQLLRFCKVPIIGRYTLKILLIVNSIFKKF